MGGSFLLVALWLIYQSVLAQFFPQCAAIQSQHRRGMTLIVVGVAHHCFKERLLHLVQYHVIEFTAGLSIKGVEEVGNRFTHTFSERRGG